MSFWKSRWGHRPFVNGSWSAREESGIHFPYPEVLTLFGGATLLSIDSECRTLENGLAVVLAPDSTVPVVAVNLWYGVGSRNEREGRTGFAHLFEHMMFQGSAHVPKGQHFELLESAGGSMNATTWFDRTNYFETLPAHQLDLALIHAHVQAVGLV